MFGIHGQGAGVCVPVFSGKEGIFWLQSQEFFPNFQKGCVFIERAQGNSQKWVFSVEYHRDRSQNLKSLRKGVKILTSFPEMRGAFYKKYFHALGLQASANPTLMT
jgi:hypothetical protein